MGKLPGDPPLPPPPPHRFWGGKEGKREVPIQHAARVGGHIRMSVCSCVDTP